MIMAGARWNVGSGREVQIIGQPWLRNDSCPYVTTDLQELGNNKVAGLMEVDNRVWDTDIVRDLFNDRDHELILNTLVCATRDEDLLYWSKEVSGNYSVKSAYKFLQVQRNAWGFHDRDNFWSLIWKVKAPPKTLSLL